MRKLFLIIMTLMSCSWAIAQTTISGTVVDAANNEPLVGATIMPIGGGNGAATDIDGKFSITVPASVKQAKVSYIGYKEQTVALSNGMTVRLASTDTNLDDLVVVAYGTGTKESLTGSVAVVGAKEIEDRPIGSVTAALEGNAPGVLVDNSTTRPGQSPSIRIRGFNSFSNNTPLYVVDGVVYQGDIADINPADIESMSVLKDAASCALYGNRGANGVILINTKRAKNQGNVNVTLQVRQGFINRGLPYYNTLEGDEWMETSLLGYTRGRMSSGVYTGTLADALAQAGPGFINDYAQGTNIYDLPADEVFNAAGKVVAKRLPGYTDLDWWDVISRQGYRQEYNVNATGATDKFDVFASAGYLKESGYMLQTDFERFNGRVVANFQPVSYFKTGVNLAASHTNSEAGMVDDDNMSTTVNPFLVNNYAPIRPYYEHDENGNIVYDENGNPVWNTGGLNGGENIAWLMRENKNNWKATSVNASLYGTVFIPYGFDLTVRGNIYRSHNRGMEYSSNKIGSLKGDGGIDLTNELIFSHTFMQTLNWAHDYGMHHVDVLLDHENYEYGYETTFLRKQGQMLPDNITLSYFENNVDSSQSNLKIRTESYLGRARYNYDQKYFGEFSLRRDGTSRFAKDNRWGTFWSIGASWIITKEKFMESTQDWLNYLKFRAAYGSVGNDAAASAYASWSTYFAYNYDNVGTFAPGTIAGSNLKWESTKTLDLALEGSLFNDRFTFSIGYFDKRNADLLYKVRQPLSAGGVIAANSVGNAISVLQNIGTMANRGWELQFGYDILRGGDWNWSVNLDASFVKNKIISLPFGRDIPGSALFQGKSLYEQYTYEWAGVDRVTGNSLYYMNPQSPDYYKYDDNGVLYYDQDEYDSNVASAKSDGSYYELNGVPMTSKVTYAKRKIMGSALPTVYGSFGTALSWKGINLNLLFTYSLGGKSNNSVYSSLMKIQANPSALHKDLLKAWTEEQAIPGYFENGEAVYGAHKVVDNVNILNPGDVDPNGVPVLNTVMSEYNDAASSRWLVSNNYLSMKNLNISYDFPKKWAQAMMLQGINVGFSVDNLFLITRQKGLNPQYSFNGGQDNYYVPSRTFSFQLNVKF